MTVSPTSDVAASSFQTASIFSTAWRHQFGDIRQQRSTTWVKKRAGRDPVIGPHISLLQSNFLLCCYFLHLFASKLARCKKLEKSIATYPDRCHHHLLLLLRRWFLASLSSSEASTSWLWSIRKGRLNFGSLLGASAHTHTHTQKQ